MVERHSIRSAVVVLAVVVVMAIAMLRPSRVLESHNAESYVTGLSTYSVQSDAPQPIEPDLTGSASGLILDDFDQPVPHLEVELMPAEKTDNGVETIREWTDGQGQYTFSHVQPGEYVLCVHCEGAPTGKHPFATAFYPGVEHRGEADHVLVATAAATTLRPIKLRKIETVVIDAEVMFDDGAHPEWSNLLIHNPSFPHEGVIGSTSIGVSNGIGQFTLPTGFTYYARAVVNCDAGSRIETRESRPIQTITAEDGRLPDKMRFIIIGPPCVLWKPPK